VVSFAEDGLTLVRSSAVALADEALSHFIILVNLMTSLGETDSRQLVDSVETLHEFGQGPHVLGVQELLKESDDAFRIVELY
jgi:hypothetical protein